MSQITRDHANRVLSTFQAYIQAVETLKHWTIGTEIMTDDEQALIVAEARVHTFHNVQKMIEDDKKMAWVREQAAALRDRLAKKRADDDRIRAIVRDVLAEVQK